jgi:hypothetical protein
MTMRLQWLRYAKVSKETQDRGKRDLVKYKRDLEQYKRDLIHYKRDLVQ